MWFPFDGSIHYRYISPTCREASNGRICTKFCTEGRLADVITCFKFCVDRLRGFGSARGRILPFSMTQPVAINTRLRYRAPVIKRRNEIGLNAAYGSNAEVQNVVHRPVSLPLLPHSAILSAFSLLFHGLRDSKVHGDDRKTIKNSVSCSKKIVVSRYSHIKTSLAMSVPAILMVSRCQVSRFQSPRR